MLRLEGKKPRVKIMTDKQVYKQMLILKSLHDKYTWKPKQHFIPDVRFCEY